MSTGKPTIYKRVTISNSGGSTNQSNYDLVLVEGLSLDEAPRETSVDENQTVQHGFDSTFTFTTYNLEILDDVRVQYGAEIPTQLSRLVFEGASGASTKTIDGLRLSGYKVLGGERDAALIKATVRSANSVIVIS